MFQDPRDSSRAARRGSRPDKRRGAAATPPSGEGAAQAPGRFAPFFGGTSHEDLRRSGIERVGAVPWGTHFCQLYETAQDLVDTLVPYFLAGLAANEFCMWVTSAPLRVDMARAALRAALPDLDHYLDKGQIEILDHGEWYTRSGKFDAGEVLQGWLGKLAAARQRGYEGLRLTGNTFWLEETSWDDFTRYEETVDDVIGQQSMLALCTYSLERCGTREILDVIANHQFALIKHAGRWEVIESAAQRKTQFALRESEERLRVAAGVAELGVFEWDAAADRAVWENERMYEIFGRDPKDGPLTTAQLVAEVIHPDDVEAFEAALAEGARTGRAFTAPCRIRRLSDGALRVVEFTGHFERGADPSSLRGVGVLRDVTESRLREEELGRLSRTLRALSNSNQAFMRAAGEAEFLDAVCRIVVEDCGHAMVWIGYAGDDEAKSVRPVASAGFEAGYLETLKITWADTERGRGPTGTAIRTGRASMCRNMLTDPKFAPWREQALARGYASSVVLPLLSDGKAFGAISIYSREPDSFAEDEVGLLSELANDLAYGITAIRLRIAHQQAEEALARSEAQHRSLFNGMTEGFAVHEILTDENGEPRDYRFLDVNPAFERQTGLRREDVVGKLMSEILPGEDPHWIRAFGAVALTGEPAHFENYAPVLRRHYEVSAYRPAPRQFAVVFMDITARKETEQLDQAINSVNEVIHSTLDADEILQRALDKAAEALGCDTAAISLRQQHRWVVRHVHGFPPKVIGTEMGDEEERHAAFAIQTKAPVAIDDALEDPRVNREHMRRWGIRSVLVVPLLSRLEVVGVIFFNFQRSAFAFQERHVAFAKKLAASLVLALENSRLYADVRWELAERKRAEREIARLNQDLQRRVAELETIFDTAPIGLAIAEDSQGHHIRGNRANEELFGLPPGAELSKAGPAPAGFRLLQDGRELAVSELPMQRAVRGETVTGMVMDAVREDGGTLTLFSSSRPLFDEAGRPRGAVGAFLDITPLRQAEAALRESEAQFRAMFEVASVGMVQSDPRDGRLLNFNEKYREITDYSEAELRRTRFPDLTHPDDREHDWEIFSRAARGETPDYRNEKRYVRKDGSVVWVRVNAAFIRDAAGKPVRTAAVVEDISERKRAEREHVWLASFPRMNPNPIVEVDLAGGIHFINAAARTAFPDLEARQLEHPWFADWEPVARALRMNEGGTYLRDVAVGEHWYQQEMFVVPGAERVRIYSLDITGRKRAEQALRESEQRFKAVASSTPDHVLVQDRELRYSLVVNPQLDLTEEEMIGKTDYDILPKADADELTRIKRQVLETGKSTHLEASLASRRGDREFFDGSYIPRFDADGQVIGLIGYFRNVTERKRTEQALRESEERYRALVELAPEAVVVHQEGRYVYANSAGIRLFGAATPDELIGQHVLDLVHPNDRELVAGRIRTVAEGGTVPAREVRLMRLDGQVILTESAAAPIEFRGRPAVQVILRDVTERRKLEERLAHAQKMEAIGLLAGGVAHDFNNLLVGVIGNASLAQEVLPPSSGALPLLERIVRTGEQAAYLTRQLLAYAGKGQIVMEPVDLSQLVREAADLMRSSIPNKITLHLDLADELPPVKADHGQVNQVVMNLTLNASEAIGSGPGVISIRTMVRNLDEGALTGMTGAELRPGTYVCLEVADNGSGMNEETKAKIFDPFFTTKFLGRGLGLAAVSGIVRSHGGGIRVESEPGRGSLFTVLLPAVAGEVPAVGAGPAVQQQRGDGTILLIDDEEIVLETAKSALERRGYEVLVAPSGPAALKLFRREAARIALVVLDLSMPGMGGDEVMPELQRIRPDVRVVVSSGYSQDQAMKYFKGQAAVGFIQKPYTAIRLAAEVKRAIGRAG